MYFNKIRKIFLLTLIFFVNCLVHARIVNFDTLVNYKDVLGSFKSAVESLSKDSLVVVDFWTKPCPTCSNISSAFDKLNGTYADRIVIIKIFAKKYLRYFAHSSFYPNTSKVAKVPRILIFKDGTKVDDFMADRPQDVINRVNKFLN